MGELFSVLAAVIWAMAVIFLRKSGEHVPPLALNLFRVAVTSPLFILTLLAAGQPILSGAPISDYLILFASGIIAIAISDTLLHKSLNMVGAGVSAITGCLYSPFVTIMAFLMIDEKLGLGQFVGMGLVASGVIVAAKHKPPEGATRGQIALGVMWGVLAMATVAFGIVIAKPVLVRSSVLWATAMRQLGSLAVLLPAAIVLPRYRKSFAVFKPSASWKFTLPATLLGSYFALMAWITGMKYTLTGIASILNQTSTVFILIFATLILREPFTRRKLIAVALAITGIIVVTLSPTP